MFCPEEDKMLEMSTKTMQFNVLQTHILSFIFLVKKDNNNNNNFIDLYCANINPGKEIFICA